MNSTQEASYQCWLEKHATTTVLIYSGLIAVFLPGFHFVLRAVPGNAPDSLSLRLVGAAIAAIVALVLIVAPQTRRFASALQYVNVLPTMLIVAVLVVDSGNNYLYIASGLLVIVGAQQAFLRALDLAIVMCIAFLFQVAYTAIHGGFFEQSNLVALAVFGSAYVIAYVPAVLRIRIQEREIRTRLAAQDMRNVLEERERALRKTQELLAEVHAITNLGNWTRSLIDDSVSWSPELLRIFKLPSDFPASALRGLYPRSIHPDDMARVMRELSFAQEIGAPFNIDHRITLKDGSTRWVHLQGKCEFEGARPVRLVSAVLDITERKEAAARLEQLAHVDTLTELPNRTTLAQRLSEMLRHASSIGAQSAVLFLDLDRFKDINDTLGHELGDTLLRAVAIRLAGTLPSEALLARWGGDEFVVVLPVVTYASEAAEVARRLVQAIAEPFFIDGYELIIAGSIGIAMYPGHGSDGIVLIRNADTAMYRAKEQYTGGFAFFEPKMHEDAVTRHRIQLELRKAIATESLTLHYQPIVRSSSRDIVGAEALLRWIGPDGNLRQPGEFISIAEESGLIIPIGTWVLRSACKQLAHWERSGIDVVVSVNVSARQFAHPEFIDTLALVLRETGVDPRHLDIEITESALMSNVESVLCVLEQLRGMKISVSIDDFGTGYSSLAYLKRFPLNALKLDYAFVNGIDNAQDRAIARSIINIAHTLCMEVTAEGVEALTQYDILSELHCDRIQGYYISRALPVSEFEAFYAACDAGIPRTRASRVTDLSARRLR